MVDDASPVDHAPYFGLIFDDGWRYQRLLTVLCFNDVLVLHRVRVLMVDGGNRARLNVHEKDRGKTQMNMCGRAKPPISSNSAQRVALHILACNPHPSTDHSFAHHDQPDKVGLQPEEAGYNQPSIAAG